MVQESQAFPDPIRWIKLLIWTKLGDIKHIIAEEIINITTNRTITVKDNNVGKKTEKTKCFALRQLA